MNEVIYVIVDKDGKCPTKSVGWNDTRKLLVYTTYARAKGALKSRGLSAEEHDIIEYVPKKEGE
jgi:hypothetical protein